MPISQPSRLFIGAALVHLVAAGVFVAFGSWDGVLTVRWDAFLWLLLVGFVGFFTIGFALHLFPPMSRRVLRSGIVEQLIFPLGEGAVILGTLAAGWPLATSPPGWAFSLGALLYLVCVALLLLHFIRMMRSPRISKDEPSVHPGDAATIPLFLASWVAASAAGVLFVLSGVAVGPGFGWWIAGIHLFVLGHVALLIVAVTLRLAPRSLGVDPPHAAASALAAFGIVGAISVPLGMLLSTRGAPVLLEWLALPEAVLALGFVGLLGYLGVRGRTPRPPWALDLLGAGCFVLAGGLALAMLFRTDYSWYGIHAFIGVLGFVGITILVMVFSMIAPFQRVSHAWTRRMLWVLSAAWLLALIGLVSLELEGSTASPWLFGTVGGLLVGVAATWSLGTFPVLNLDLNPLPGISHSRIQKLRDRWRGP
ncbi:MAG: hypothetical protein ACREBZ_02355 [Thermoplasmata archaeon]